MSRSVSVCISMYTQSLPHEIECFTFSSHDGSDRSDAAGRALPVTVGSDRRRQGARNVSHHHPLSDWVNTKELYSRPRTGWWTATHVFSSLSQAVNALSRRPNAYVSQRSTVTEEYEVQQWCKSSTAGELGSFTLSHLACRYRHFDVGKLCPGSALQASR